MALSGNNEGRQDGIKGGGDVLCGVVGRQAMEGQRKSANLVSQVTFE